MRRLFLCLLVCGGIAAQLHSQTPARPVVATIAGHVVDAMTGKPIAGAAVRLQPLHKPEGSCGVSNFGDGRFLCEVYEGGDFYLSASYRGYSSGWFGMRAPDDGPQVFDLAAGEHVNNITLRMWKNGAVTGRVVDAAGDPITGAIVTAISVSPDRSRELLVMSRTVVPTATTDDRGIYRVIDVTPGTYVIVLTHNSPASAPASPIFYPNVASYSAARVVAVASGADLTDINFAEARTRTFTVSGRLLGRASAPPASYDAHTTSIRLLPADAPDTPGNFAVASIDVLAQAGGNGARDREGAFSFVNVPPGKYIVRIVDFPKLGPIPMVMSPDGTRLPMPLVTTMWAEMPVTVSDHDVTDVPVTLRPAARLTGRIVFDDATVKQSPGGAPIALIRADGRDDGRVPVGVTEVDGTFRTAGVPPGRYTLVALPSNEASNWRMTSAIAGGRELAASGFQIGADDITNVVVTMQRQASTLSGFVRDASGAAQPDASLYVFAVDPARWGRPVVPALATLSIELRPNRHGKYTLDLPAGDYYAAAAINRLPDWRTPENLNELAKTATRVTIAAGEQKTQDLTIRH